jgi:molybdate transport system substrate-binding protein
MATRRVLAELVERYTPQAGGRVVVESVGGVTAAARVKAGELFDIVVLASDVVDELITAGLIVAGTRVDIVTSAIVVAVRSGTRHPDISSADAVKRAVQAARTVAYSTGPSGSHLAKLFKDWGVADAIKDRVTVAPPGVPVGSLVARGDIELGFQQLSEFIGVDGVDVVGMLPPDIQHITTFSGGIAQASTQRDAAASLLRFFADPALADIKRRSGMAPPYQPVAKGLSSDTVTGNRPKR